MNVDQRTAAPLIVQFLEMSSMINVYSHLMSAWPATMVMSPKLNRKMPTFSQVWDYERITPASAAGETLKSIQGAIGEYFERRHFLMRS